MTVFCCVVLLSPYFYFGISGIRAGDTRAKCEGWAERHRAHHGQRWKGGIFGNDDKEVMIMRAFSRALYEKGVCIVTNSIETNAAARALLLRLHETADLR